ncbi:MAG TPA: zf-HC2 domain-containing protein [Acidimicrobiales bacterium]|nr:zf-HC2 domain-containing protein [Acidimicrobiales bacterium]
MADTDCDVARESLAELALGTLRGEELRRVSAHVEHCKECRHEVTAMVPVASQLLELIPGTEPPLGFDRRVLSRVEHVERGTGPLTRRRGVIMAVAAAAAIVFGISGWLVGAGSSSHHQNQSQVAADFVQQGRDVGRIEAHGTPLWLTVTVRGTGISGPVTCEVVHEDGSITTMGSFDLVGGSGTWSTPDPEGMANVTQAQLVGTDGKVVAVAHFS